MQAVLKMYNNMGISIYDAAEVLVNERKPTLVWSFTLDIPLCYVIMETIPSTHVFPLVCSLRQVCTALYPQVYVAICSHPSLLH